MHATMKLAGKTRRSPWSPGVGARWPGGAGAAVAADDDPWPDIRRDVFDDREIVEDDGTITLEAPYRAEDAAVVPLTVRIPASIARDVKSLTLVIDKNPAPVAADVPLRRGRRQRRAHAVDPRAHRHVFQRPRRGRDRRRQAAHGDEVREGLGRLLGAGLARTPTRRWPASARCRSRPSSRPMQPTARRRRARRRS